MQGANAGTGDRQGVLVSASIAFDYIMSFPGSFGDHILPDKTHVLSVSFLVDSLKRRRGGVAGNIAYSLALLGERPLLAGASGADFGPYRNAFDELGVDLSLVIDVPGELTASAFMMSDLKNNQIASFYPGAGMAADELPLSEAAASVRYGIVGATGPVAMRKHSAEIAGAGARLFYDPSQQIVALAAEDLIEGIDNAWGFVANDYEFAMVEQKTGLTFDAIKERVALIGITLGGEGSEIHHNGEVHRIPPVVVPAVLDPTGAGDAYRAGLLKGLLLDADIPVAGRIASLAAAYAVEQLGTQEHIYTPDEFIARFDAAFPDFAGAIAPDQLRALTGVAG
ncbi:MAG: carbohydrate kinase family protein [Thermomicrobiales bacterium]|nr:carbohydrate kinase family protein [Thermomicrobiales bacterium]